MAVQGKDTTPNSATVNGCRAFGTGQACVFSSNGTFVVPSDVSKVKVHVHGPGGGGAYMGGGGAGGGYASCTVCVTPGTTCCILVGPGGTAGNTSSYIGANGGISCAFGACATGGQGGCSILCCNTVATIAPASPGCGVGTVSYCGGSGSCCAWGGAGGAATKLGNGGAGGNVIQGGGGGAGGGAGCIGGGSPFGPGTATTGAPDNAGVCALFAGRTYGNCDAPQVRYPGELIAGGGGGCCGGAGGIGGGSGGRGGCCAFYSGVPGNVFGGASGGIKAGAKGGTGAGGSSAGFCIGVCNMWGGGGAPITYCTVLPVTHNAYTPALGCVCVALNISGVERYNTQCCTTAGTPNLVVEKAHRWAALTCCTISCGTIPIAWCGCLCCLAGGWCIDLPGGVYNTPCCNWNYRSYLWTNNHYHMGMQYYSTARSTQCCYNCNVVKDGYVYRLYFDAYCMCSRLIHEDCCGICPARINDKSTSGYYRLVNGYKLGVGVICPCITTCDTRIGNTNVFAKDICSLTCNMLIDGGSGFCAEFCWHSVWDVDGVNCAPQVSSPYLWYNVSSCDCSIRSYNHRGNGYYYYISTIALCNGNFCVCKDWFCMGNRPGVFSANTGDTLICCGYLASPANWGCNAVVGVQSGAFISGMIGNWSTNNGYCRDVNICQCCPSIGTFAQCYFYSKNCPASCTGRVVMTNSWCICENCMIGATCFIRKAYITSPDVTWNCCNSTAATPMCGFATGTELWHYNKMLCDMPASCPDIWTMLAFRGDPTWRHAAHEAASASFGITTDPTCNCYVGASAWSGGCLGCCAACTFDGAGSTPDPLSVRYLPSANVFVAFEGGNCTGRTWYGWSCTLEGDWNWCCHTTAAGTACLVQCNVAGTGVGECLGKTRLGLATFPPSGACVGGAVLNIVSGDRVVMINAPTCPSNQCCNKCYYRCCLYVTDNIKCYTCWCKYTFPCCGTGDAVYVKQFDRFYVTHMGGYFSYSNRSVDGIPIFCNCCISTASVPFCDQQGGLCADLRMNFHWNRLCCTQFNSNLGCSEVKTKWWNAIRKDGGYNDCYGWSIGEGYCHESPAMYLRMYGTCYAFGITTDGVTWGWKSLVPADPYAYHVVGGANSTIMIASCTGSCNAYFYSGNTSVSDITCCCFMVAGGCRMIMHHNGNFLMWDQSCVKNSLFLTANNTAGCLSLPATWTRTPSSITTLVGTTCESGVTAILCTKNCSNQTCFLMVRQPICTGNGLCCACYQLARSSDLCNWTLACTTMCWAPACFIQFDVCDMTQHYDPCYDLTFLGTHGQFVALNNNLTSVCQLRCTFLDPTFVNQGFKCIALYESWCCGCAWACCPCNSCFPCHMWTQNCLQYWGGMCYSDQFRCRGTAAVCPQMTGTNGVMTSWPFYHPIHFSPDCNFANTAAPQYLFNKQIGPAVLVTYNTCSCLFTLEAKPQGWAPIVCGYIACCNHFNCAGSGGDGMVVIEY